MTKKPTYEELLQEIAKLKDLSVACLCCDWHYESKDPYKVFKVTIEHFLTHKKAWNNEQRKINKKLEERLGQIREHTKNFPDFEKCQIEDCPKEHCMNCSNREYIGFCYFMESLAKWLEELVGLLEATKVGKRIQN